MLIFRPPVEVFRQSLPFGCWLSFGLSVIDGYRALFTASHVSVLSYACFKFNLIGLVCWFKGLERG